MFYYTNRDNEVTIWGNYTIPDDAKSFIVLGYVQDGGVAIPSDICFLYCTTKVDGDGAENRWTLAVKPNELVQVANQEVGTITKLQDPGTRVRILIIK